MKILPHNFQVPALLGTESFSSTVTRPEHAAPKALPHLMRSLPQASTFADGSPLPGHVVDLYSLNSGPPLITVNGPMLQVFKESYPSRTAPPRLSLGGHPASVVDQSAIGCGAEHDLPWHLIPGISSVHPALGIGAAAKHNSFNVQPQSRQIEYKLRQAREEYEMIHVTKDYVGVKRTVSGQEYAENLQSPPTMYYEKQSRNAGRSMRVQASISKPARKGRRTSRR
jgi:hypothetical protein